MAYCLRRDESVARGVHRVVCRELEGAVELAGDGRVGVDERIHEVRLSLKRARAALKLVAGSAVRRTRRDDRALREIGRALAPARDRAVARAALGSVSRQLGRGAAKGTGRRPKLLPLLRKELAGDGAEDALVEAARAISKASRGLSVVRVTHGRTALAGGFERAYRRARRGRRRVETDDAVVRFHEWRKDVKRLRYQVQLVGDAAPSLLGAMEPLLERLGKQLGELHDVTFLAAVVAEVELAKPLRAERERWLEHLEARAQVLRAETRALGASVLSEKPSAVRRRVAASWSRWRAADG